MNENGSSMIERNDYEITLIYPTREDDYQETKKKVEGLFQEFDMRVVSEKDWGSKELAYPILKNTHGHYHIYMIDTPPSSIKKFTKEMVLLEKVFRYIVIHIDKKARKHFEKLEKKEKEKKTV